MTLEDYYYFEIFIFQIINLINLIYKEFYDLREICHNSNYSLNKEKYKLNLWKNLKVLMDI